MKQIAVLITTFLRDDLAIEALQKIEKHWNSQYKVFLANQSYKNDVDKLNAFSKYSQSTILLNNLDWYYYNVSYDGGLSYARNLLVNRAIEHDFKYCLLMADSLHMNAKYDFTNIIAFLESDKNNGIVGFNINNRVSWEYDLELIKNEHFLLKKSHREKIVFNETKFQPVDICRNFFIAKTECLLENKWDENLKLTEHEDFFYRLKQTNWKTYWTDSISCDYKNFKPDSYTMYRRRMYKEFQDVLKKKYSLKGWVRYARD